jgi:hypothetical protein
MNIKVSLLGYQLRIYWILNGTKLNATESRLKEEPNSEEIHFTPGTPFMKAKITYKF